MRNKIFGFVVGLLVASVLVGIATVTEEVQEKQGQSYEFCRDKLFINFMTQINNFCKKNKLKLVRLLGFEPRTSWSVAKRSIQLSYRRYLIMSYYIGNNYSIIKYLLKI